MDGVSIISLFMGFILGSIFTLNFSTYNHRIEYGEVININDNIYKCEFLDSKKEDRWKF